MEELRKFERTQLGGIRGDIMQRVTSKKIFKKWSPRYFVLEEDRFSLYRTRLEWETGRSPETLVILKALTFISPVMRKEQDEEAVGPRLAWLTEIKENDVAEMMPGQPRPIKFTSGLPVNPLAKIGMVNRIQMLALWAVLDHTIELKQKEAMEKANKKAARGQRY
jgi:hypothetical protein